MPHVQDNQLSDIQAKLWRIKRLAGRMAHTPERLSQLHTELLTIKQLIAVQSLQNANTLLDRLLESLTAVLRSPTNPTTPHHIRSDEAA